MANGVGGISESSDTDFDIAGLSESAGLPGSTPDGRPSPLGAGFLILVARELTGMSQRRLANAVGTSQPALARIETGAGLPALRTLLRIAAAAELDLVIGLRGRGAPSADPEVLEQQGFALVGTLHPNPEDGLADFVVLREPHPWEGPAGR